jgi:hypothetical protein
MLLFCALCFATAGMRAALAGGAAPEGVFAARGIAGLGDHKHRCGAHSDSGWGMGTVAFGGTANGAVVMPEIPRSVGERTMLRGGSAPKSGDSRLPSHSGDQGERGATWQSKMRSGQQLTRVSERVPGQVFIRDLRGARSRVGPPAEQNRGDGRESRTPTSHGHPEVKK